MNDIIRGMNYGYARYEELIMKRDKTRKMAKIYQDQYMAEFGDLIISVFEKKIECIKKKKKIAFCQLCVNKGESIDETLLAAYLEEEMREYNDELDRMIEETDLAKRRTRVCDEEYEKIKKIYRSLAKKIHPDINPKTEDIEELKTLWQMIVTSYNCNDLESLEEAEIMVNMILKKLGEDVLQVSLINLDEKIRKIEEDIFLIKSTNPYQYKYILHDPYEIDHKKSELQDEYKEYSEYEKGLEKILNQMLLAGGVSVTWQMKLN